MDAITPSSPRDIRLAYARGYNRAAHWPSHRPPYPPQPIIEQMMKATRRLRDAIDSQLATFDPDDPMSVMLGPYIDAVDESLEAVSNWIKDNPH